MMIFKFLDFARSFNLYCKHDVNSSTIDANGLSCFSFNISLQKKCTVVSLLHNLHLNPILLSAYLMHSIFRAKREPL